MRSRIRTLAVLAALAVAVVVFVLARGDDGGTPVTHEELVARANAACERLGRQNQALEAPPKPYDDQSAPFFTAVEEHVAALKDELDALDPTGEDEAELGRLVGLYGRIEVELEKLETAAAVEQGQEMETVLDEITRVARETAEVERTLGVCPGDRSVQVVLVAQLRRSRPNPLTETGPLG